MKASFRVLYVSLLFGFIAHFSHAQILDPVDWSFSTEALGNNEYNLVFTAKIDKGWTVYSQYIDEDAGPVPTYIEFESKDGVELIGKSEEFGKKKAGFDKIFEAEVIKFLALEPYVIKQKVKLSGAEATVSGYLTYMTCDDTKCLPPTDEEFSFILTGGGDTAEAVQASKTTETKAPQPASTGANAVVENQPKVENRTASSEEPQQDAATKTQDVQAVTTTASAPQFGTVSNLGGGDEIFDPVKWDHKIEDLGNNEYKITSQGTIEKGWSIYSHYTEDNGPLPTIIEFETADVKTIGSPEETGKQKKEFDKLFDVNVIKFSADQPYTISQKLSVPEGSSNVIGWISYMSCNDTRCTNGETEFSLPLGAGAVASNAVSGVAGTVGSLPLSNPFQSGGSIDQVRPRIVETLSEPAGECGAGETVEEESFLKLLILGLLGGFIALLTPCVFPMIPITVSFFTKDTKRKGWMNGLIYGLSIISIYVVLGLLITIFVGPEALNALSTNWIANVIFFLIFIFFAFSFFGFYELTLPSSWSTKTDGMADKGGLIGIFFMAATLAIVSFSCTGPIIGSALVSAADGGNFVGPLIVMFGFSAALALPFGLFAAFPAWLNSLPRSGSWMNSVKVVLGFLELGFAFKFLSKADLTEGWGLLKYEPFLLIWVLVAFAIALYLFGFIKFPHDSPIKKLSLPRKAWAVGFAALGIYLATGFFVNDKTGLYKSTFLMSGIAPPAIYNMLLEPDQLDPAIKSKYKSYSKCANNINCFKDYYEGVAYAKEVGKPVFLDFTGYGCENCRRTEDFIWVEDEIWSVLNDDVVLVSLYVDDRKKLEKTVTSKNSGKKIRNVGNKWTDFQIVNFNQNSQPLYVMMDADEEILTYPRGYRESSEDYMDFLECGLNTYKKK